MLTFMASVFRRLAITSGGSGPLQNHMKTLTAGIKTFPEPPDYSGVVLPEKLKLKFIKKVPNFKKATKEMKNLKCIRGPAVKANSFTRGQYGIVAMGGGFLHWGHFEMMRLTINRKIDSETTFARWGVNAPDKPITRKGLGKRMGGGKGEIDHYVTPVRCGRIIVELGGHVEFQEVEPVLTEVVKKLPFPAKVVSRESLAAMKQEEQELELNNQNPWTFKRIVSTNMLGIRKVLSPYDLKYQGKYSGKFRIPGRV
ncbi:RM16 protein, partial [Polypterus senegalus]|nr:39S ribosomal protein L16, mitochondrial [Polypterus senegalus]MBN3292565.1 RM16 protein [Polypterus senegalus]